MNRPSSLLILAGVLSFCAAIFQAVIAFVPAWSAAFGAGDALVSNPPLLLTFGLLVALLLVIFGLYGLSGAGVIRRLPLLRPGLFVIGLLYCLVGINFIFQVLAMLGILPSAGPIPIYTTARFFWSLSRGAGVPDWTGGQLEAAVNQACSSRELMGSRNGTFELLHGVCRSSPLARLTAR